jgi:hypothetical protein
MIYDLVSNTYITTLPLSNVEYQNGIYKAYQMTGDIPVTTDTLALGIRNATIPGKHALYILRNDECVWGGIIWSREYQAKARSLKITALTFEAYLYSRLWRRTKVYSGVSQYAIARQILAFCFDDFNSYDSSGGGVSDWTGVVSPDPALGGPTSTTTPNRYVRAMTTAANVGITVPAAPLTVNEYDASFLRQETDLFMGYNMKTIGDVLYEFATEEANAATVEPLVPEVSFEYRINCVWDPSTQTFSRQFLFGYRKFGRPNDGSVNDSTNYVVFDYPGSISDYSTNETIEGAATRAWETGAGSGVEKIVQPVYDHQRLEVEGWPLLEQVEADGRIYDPRTLTYRARSFLTERRAPIPSFSVTVEGNEYPQFKLPVGNPARWDVGDWIRLRIDDPYFHDSTTGSQIRVYDARVVRYKVKVSGDPDHALESITMEYDDFHQYHAPTVGP